MQANLGTCGNCDLLTLQVRAGIGTRKGAAEVRQDEGSDSRRGPDENGVYLRGMRQARCP